MVYERKNQGTCSVLTRVELNPDHTIEAVSVLGGMQWQPQGHLPAAQRHEGRRCHHTDEGHYLRQPPHKLPGSDLPCA